MENLFKQQSIHHEELNLERLDAIQNLLIGTMAGDLHLHDEIVKATTKSRKISNSNIELLNN